MLSRRSSGHFTRAAAATICALAGLLVLAQAQGQALTTSPVGAANPSLHGASAAVHGVVSTTLTVSGAVQRPGRYDLAALQALPAVTRSAGSASYTGVDLWTFLHDVVGIAGRAGAKNPSLDLYVVATGSDGYRAVFSLGELDAAFGNQPDLIAYAVDGAGLGNSGFARLVVPRDGKGGRHVSNLTTLEVFLLPPIR